MKTKYNLLPDHYTKVKEPFFMGSGHHNILQLEAFAEGYKELSHQLRVEKQALWDISNTLLDALEKSRNFIDNYSQDDSGTVRHTVKENLAIIDNAIATATGKEVDSEAPATEEKFDWKTCGDFRKYYDTTQKRNIWVLGYFGGGSVNISDAYRLSKQYAEATGVPVENVQIDEILNSRRFKGFKFLYSNSTDEQKMESGAEQMENVYAWLRD